MFAPLAIMLGWRIDCLGALVEFYGYLAQNNIVSRDAAARIQTELQEQLHGLLHYLEEEPTVAGPRLHVVERYAQA